jgi:hypothetical protein
MLPHVACFTALQTVGNLEGDKGLPVLKQYSCSPLCKLCTVICGSFSMLQTVGNHEWDKGLPALKQYLDKQDNKAVLAANIDFQGHELQHKIKPYVVKQVKGKKVGVQSDCGVVQCCAADC